jgi:hypothetical protein
MSLADLDRPCDQCKEMRPTNVDLCFRTGLIDFEAHFFCSLICLEKWVFARNMLTSPAAGPFR